MTPTTAAESNLSPITPKRYAVTSEIEEEAHWDQTLEDENELVEKKNYKVKAG